MIQKVNKITTTEDFAKKINVPFPDNNMEQPSFTPPGAFFAVLLGQY